MNKRPLLLINGRWTRLDEIVSLNRRIDAGSDTIERGDMVYVRKGRPYIVFRTSGFIKVASRRSGRQLIAITNQEQ